MSVAEPETQTTPPAGPAEPGPLPRRILETFTSPGTLFSRFPRASSPWLDVAIIAGVVMALAAALIPSEAYVELFREQLRNAPTRPGQPVPDPASFATIGKVGGALSALAYPLVGAVVVAGLLKLLFGVMLGGEGTFTQYLGVYAHAALIVALGSLVTLPVIVASGDLMRQLNFALLLPDPDRSSLVYRLLMQTGIFNLWQYAVIAIGVAAVNRGRISRAAAWGGVAALYAMTAVIGALMQRS